MKSNRLDYLIDPTFRSISRLFVISFENGDDPTRNYFAEYYMLLVEIKDFIALIDNKPFFDQLRSVPKIVEMSRNDDYTAGKLLGYLRHQRHYKFIVIDLSRQINMCIAQQLIKFYRKIRKG